MISLPFRKLFYDSIPINDSISISIGNKITFHPKNDIAYGQDHGFHRCVPHNIQFEIDNFITNERFSIKADGYGHHSYSGDKGKYGNGKIYISLSAIRDKTDQFNIKQTHQTYIEKKKII